MSVSELNNLDIGVVHLLTFIHVEDVRPRKLLFQVQVEAHLFISILASHGLVILLYLLLGGAVESGAHRYILPRLCTHCLSQLALVCLVLIKGGTLPQSLLRLKHALILAFVNAHVLVVGCVIAKIFIIEGCTWTQLGSLLSHAFIERGHVTLGHILLLDRKLHGVVLDSFVSDSRNALDKFDKQHVHVLRGVNLVDLRLDRQVEQWTDFTSSKVVIANT